MISSAQFTEPRGTRNNSIFLLPVCCSHQEKGVSGGSNSLLESSTASPEGGVGTGETAEGAGDNTADAESSATCLPPKFTLTAGECQLVRELFGWLVEPCLAFLRREVSEMVRNSSSRGGGVGDKAVALFILILQKSGSESNAKRQLSSKGINEILLVRCFRGIRLQHVGVHS